MHDTSAETWELLSGMHGVCAGHYMLKDIATHLFFLLSTHLGMQLSMQLGCLQQQKDVNFRQNFAFMYGTQQWNYSSSCHTTG